MSNKHVNIIFAPYLIITTLYLVIIVDVVFEINKMHMTL